MKTWLRRLAIGTGAAGLALVGSWLVLRHHGERHLEQMTERFVQEVGPIPEVQYTPEGTVQYSADPTHDVLARLRDGRAAGDAALEALQEGDRNRALDLLGDIAVERDCASPSPTCRARWSGSLWVSRCWS